MNTHPHICTHAHTYAHTHRQIRTHSRENTLGHHYAYTCRSHIQRSPAEFVDRQKVAEIQIRQGVERIFRLKSTLLHFGRGSGGALRTCRLAPVSH